MSDDDQPKVQVGSYILEDVTIEFTTPLIDEPIGEVKTVSTGDYEVDDRGLVRPKRDDCEECGGDGEVELLTSVVECEACDGTGRQA